ncbi:MAG: DegT/DnrJ/EryC1/StrS family aminotransferase [Chlorobi bacterium]|nr:DegT/DnrJ/EryC1/StrS family aminotransferase [Chlorobiota bacterium]
MTQIPFVDLKLQYLSIRNEIDTAIANVIRDTAFVNGKYVKLFEENFSAAHNAKHCIGVGNGTDAISIALKALDIGVGDEVITAANSFIATSEAITTAGARVVFVDCLPDTYNIDPSLIEGKITSLTKAIIPVHLYGQPADMDSIMEIAKKHGLYVLEDSAQSHIAEYNSENEGWGKIGVFGDVSTFSFYPGKNLGAYGDAGAIVTNNDKVAKKARMFANHGRVSKYDHEFEGVNSRMDGIQGAILDIKLKYLAGWVEKRREVANHYDKLLKDVPEIILPFVNTKSKHVYHLYVIRTPQRVALKTFLGEKGVSTGVHYPIALPNLSAYKYLEHSPDDFPNASKFQNEYLSLPIFPELTLEQIEYTVKMIKEFFKK